MTISPAPHPFSDAIRRYLAVLSSAHVMLNRVTAQLDATMTHDYKVLYRNRPSGSFQLCEQNLWTFAVTENWQKTTA